MILIDTNVWSELTRLSPDTKVVRWVRANQSVLATSVIVVAEALAGAEQIGGRKRRRETIALYDLLFDRLQQAPFVVDDRIARRAAALVGSSRRSGTVLRNADAIIAATAVVQRAALATRNVKDFKATGLTLIDPWTAP